MEDERHSGSSTLKASSTAIPRAAASLFAEVSEMWSLREYETVASDTSAALARSAWHRPRMTSI
ncbi:MAG: hypothetical protein IJQ81_18035 [Oscillibacter sp.]|nr:hypothetical protein [Oscillibacter sp.]